MKILILADHMDNGGAETHIYELSRLLYHRGHSVTIFSHGGRIADKLASLGVTQEKYGRYPLVKLTHFIQTEKPNIVHAHTRRSAFLCRLLLAYLRFPFVFTAHARFSADPLRRTLSYFPKRTIAVSSDIASHLTSHFGVPPKNITVIGNGIDVERFCPKRDKTERNHIVTISRLDADCSRSASLLCQIAPILNKQFEDLHITVLGGGSELAKIQRLAKRANLLCGKEVVRAVGRKQNVLPYLQSASLFIGVSRAALEAMSCGLPVILSGDEGYLGLAVGNKLSIAEEGNFCARGHRKPQVKCLVRDIILALSHPTLAARAAQEGQRQVIHFHTAEQMTEQTLAIYQAAIRDFRQTQKSDILLCGYYGYGNLGDELTLRSISASLRKAEKQRPANISPLRLSVLAPKGIEYRGLTSVNRLSPIAVLNAIRHTGVFMLGGGSLLQNKTSNRSLLYYLLLLETAHIFGIPSMLYASGIGPIEGPVPYALCRHALRRADRITVRDIDSLSLLKRMGLRQNLVLSADPVLCSSWPRGKSRGYVLVFVRDQEVGRCFELLQNIQRPIYLALMDRNKDLSATKRLASKLKASKKSVLFFEQATPAEILSLIGGAELVISARLHALILAFCMGVRFFGISDDPKISAFSKTAYGDLPQESSRAEVSAYFQRKRQELLTLAKADAKTALDLVVEL